MFVVQIPFELTLADSTTEFAVEIVEYALNNAENREQFDVIVDEKTARFKPVLRQNVLRKIDILKNANDIDGIFRFWDSYQ